MESSQVIWYEAWTGVGIMNFQKLYTAQILQMAVEVSVEYKQFS
jgi:hypothetical protein